MGHNATTWSRRPVQRLKEWLLGVPVFVKVMGIPLGMAALLCAGMFWQIHQTWHRHLVRDVEWRGQQLAVHLAEHCEELMRTGRTKEIASVLGRALLTFPDAIEVSLRDQDDRTVAEVRSEVDPAKRTKVHVLLSSTSDASYRLSLGVNTARVDEEVAQLTWQLFRITVILALVGLLAVWWISRVFSHPIEELAALAHTVKDGHYQTKAPVRARDEVGELATAFNQMTSALAQKETARRQLLRKVIGAGEEERKRLARELHDETGQALTSQIAGLSALENQIENQPLRRRLAELRQQAEQTLTAVHELSVRLRPSVLDDIGLIAALQRHCHTFAQRFGVTVNFSEIGMDGQRLPAEVELTIYRMVQEALTNAVRHGQSSRIRVHVHRSRTNVLATVQDNGCGFDAHNWQHHCLEGNHLGLLGIEERLTLLGGSFCVESEPGKGVTLYADIRFKEAA